jgi:hypothetical protein
MARAQRRQLKIARRLDPSITFFGDIPEKPKGMWWRTYHLLARGIASAEDDIDTAFTLKVDRDCALHGTCAYKVQGVLAGLTGFNQFQEQRASIAALIVLAALFSYPAVSTFWSPHQLAMGLMR